MSQRITIEIKDKIATCLTELPVVCGNADYVVDFVFDEEWNKHYVKTAVFVVNGKAVDQVFEGNTCPVPAIQNTLITQVGVFAGTVNDGTLSTSTPALVKCIPCITDGNNVPLPPPDDVYNQIIDLINKYIDGGSGEIDIRNLQAKVDEALRTYSKEVVGAINELNTIANRADENSQNGTLALEKATTAEENASAARKKAESAEEKVDALDEIAASSLQLASQSFALATEAKTNSDKSVEKTELPNQLYGTDADGNPALYPTDSVGTSVFVDGQKVKEFNADEKFDKIGGVIGGDVSIQGNLSVSGTTTTKDTETLQVKDNVIVANADGVSLVDDSGFAIKTNETEAYGIMYDPLGDGVKIGLGGFTEDGKFVYNEGEAQFLATRADNITDGNLPQWDNDKKQFVDSGEKIGDYVKNTDYATNEKAGIVKVGEGMNISSSTYKLNLSPATYEQIKNGTGNSFPITVGNHKNAVKNALTNNTETWTDEEKTKACETIGALPNKKPTNSNNGDGFLITFGTDGKTIGYKRLYGSYVDEPYSVPYRDGNGVIHGKIPTTDTGLTPKYYIDNLPDYLTLTDEQQQVWRDMIGTVSKIPTFNSGRYRFKIYGPNNGESIVEVANYGNVPTGYAMLRANGVGNITVADPINPTDASNKQYVDDNSTKLYLHEISVDNGAYKFYIVSTYSQAYDMVGLHGAMYSTGGAVNDTYGATVSVYDKKHKTISIDLDDAYGVYREYLAVVETTPGSYGRTLAHEYFAFGNWTDTVTKL